MNEADSHNTTLCADPPTQNWRPEDNRGLTHIFIKDEKTEIKLKMVALISLCKIPKNTNLKITNHMWLSPRL
jgi:hypothetical protein